MKIEEKYKELSEVQHILHRPGMWVGSTKPEEKDMFIYNNETGKMQSVTLEYVPGMLKVVDEIISNSCDEFRRGKKNMGLTELLVSIDDDNTITVRDNGGIPIVKHKTAGVYVPEFIFGRLRTSSNYNDDEDRNVIGTNGLGSSLTNVFSDYFRIDSADGINEFSGSWKDHMTPNNDVVVKKCGKNTHYTKTTFRLDLSQFKVDTIDDNFKNIIHKRCIDAAAANPGLKVIFKASLSDGEAIDETWKFKTFEDYIDLYSDLLVETSNRLQFSNKLADVYVFPGSNLDVAFVNGAECSKGTHIRAARNDINSTVADYLAKKDKIEVTTRAVNGKYAVFMNINVSNPSYDSQTKDTLTTPMDKFSMDESITWEVPQKFLEQVTKSEIVNLMRDWYKKEAAAEDQKTLRKLNAEAKKGLKRPDKYVAANSKNKHDRCLFIFEGDSAYSGFREARDPNQHGAYVMKGVPMNCLDMTPVQIMKNEVFNDIITILGLEFGSSFDIKKLKYDRIVIATDADVDGDKIAALLILFFYMNWPEIISNHILSRIEVPIIIASKGKNKKVYYKMDDYRAEQKEVKSWQIKYVKGWAGYTPSEYREIIRGDKFVYFRCDRLCESMLRKWFGKDADTRKELMSEVIKSVEE